MASIAKNGTKNHVKGAGNFIEESISSEMDNYLEELGKDTQLQIQPKVGVICSDLLENFKTFEI